MKRFGGKPPETALGLQKGAFFTKFFFGTLQKLIQKNQSPSEKTQKT
jgi:hypothetical protein